MNRFERNASLTALVAIAAMLAGCQSKTGEAASPAEQPKTVQAAAPDKPADTESVEVEPGMLANMHFEEVRSQALHRLLTATGKVQFNDERVVRVLAPLPGQLMELQLRVGDPVQKDQVLFKIKSREVGALATDYLESQRDQDLAEKTYNMTKDLYEHQAAARISLQQAESDLAKAKTHVGRAREALVVLGLDPREVESDGGLRMLVPVKASAGGSVIERTVTNGQFVQADSTPLITIADLSTVWVMVDIFERDIHMIRPGQKVQVVAVAYPERRFTASVERISDKVDPDTRTLKVRLLVSNSDQLLKPEMFISASLELGDTAAGVTVPAKALFTEGEKSYLFVKTGDRRFERRLVAAAPDGDGRLRVASGVSTGDQVVTDGALLLRLRQTQGKSND